MCLFMLRTIISVLVHIYIYVAIYCIPADATSAYFYSGSAAHCDFAIIILIPYMQAIFDAHGY